MFRFGDKVILLDGGFGSELQRLGLPTACVEDLNITHPDVVQTIHRAYTKADCITTNTFGLNRLKYHGHYSIEQVAAAAVANARVAGKHVLFDIGPTGCMMQPIGTLSFDEAYRAFQEIVQVSRDLVDGYIVETFTDLYEMKACLLAIKENCDKPVFATMTFDASGRTLTGSSPEIMVNTLQGLGADAVGVNCSMGPEGLLPIVERILAVAEVPVIVQPNRGIPKVIDGTTQYDLPLQVFVDYMTRFVDMGVAIIGGCCGTTPDFINALCPLKGRSVTLNAHAVAAANSASHLTVFDQVVVCGERLNPTGKKALKEALLEGDFQYLINEAVRQEDAGANVLDVNVGLPTVDEVSLMKQAVVTLQEYCALPLQIDSSNVDALEIGCRYYNGIPIINSVNGEQEVMERVFPIAQKYGAMVIGLTIDENGVPDSADGRVRIAERIVHTAARYGIGPHRILIDTLTLAASAAQDKVMHALQAIQMVRKEGVRTVLGVSNVSFGLPQRPVLNRTFLACALQAGLSMPILNPLDEEMMGCVRAYRVLSHQDEQATQYLAHYAQKPQESPSSTERQMTLYDAVLRGLKPQVDTLTKSALATQDAMSIINDVLLSALQKVGAQFEQGQLFLPQLIASAEVVKSAFDIIRSQFPKSTATRGVVLLATVRGDVHDIGKNICKVVMESYGFNVIDLGKDVPEHAVVQAYRQHHPDCIGLSALMTTTVATMQSTIEALHQAGCTTPIMVGGAVLNEEIARAIGADYYARDALACVNILQSIVG